MSSLRKRLSLRRTLVLGAVVLVSSATAAVIAAATPPAGIVANQIVARGTVTENVVLGTPTTKVVRRTVRVRVRGRTVTRRVRLTVPSVRTLIRCNAARPCETAFQQLTIAPGGHTGWHTHPGPAYVAIAEGEGTLYHGGRVGTGCAGHRYAVGSGFLQPSTDVHLLRNEGSVPLVVHTLYVVPPGTPNTALRTDQPQPANCPTIP